MSQTMAKISGISVQLFQSLNEFATQILPGPHDLTPGFAVAINPEKIMAARRDPLTRAALESATLRYADGAGVIWAMRRRGYNAPRVTGCDLWEQLMARAAKCEVPVALLGAQPEVLQATIERLRSEIPTLEIAASQHGYGNSDDLARFAESLGKMGRGIVAVAMGSPRQEKIIKSLRESYPDAFYMGVGGSFDCYSGAVKRAPAIWQRHNLEWLYRLLCQPWRWRRQLKLIPYVALVLSKRV